MNCTICGGDKLGIKLFGEIICKDCIREITNISADDEKYDKYKNIIRILLSLYIYDRHQLNPVN